VLHQTFVMNQLVLFLKGVNLCTSCPSDFVPFLYFWFCYWFID